MRVWNWGKLADVLLSKANILWYRCNILQWYILPLNIQPLVLIASSATANIVVKKYFKIDILQTSLAPILIKWSIFKSGSSQLYRDGKADVVCLWSPGKHNSLPQFWASLGPLVIVNQCTRLYRNIAMPVIYKVTFSLRRVDMKKGQSMVKY